MLENDELVSIQWEKAQLEEQIQKLQARWAELDSWEKELTTKDSQLTAWEPDEEWRVVRDNKKFSGKKIWIVKNKKKKDLNMERSNTAQGTLSKTMKIENSKETD